MDLSAQYQQQQQEDQYLSTQTYHQSQQQEAYDQSNQTYYYGYHQQYQQQQYPYNYTQEYTNPNYQQQQLQSQQVPTSIHPPGVPIPPDPTHLVAPEQAHSQNQLNSYYPQQQQLIQAAGNVDYSQQWQGNYGGYGAVPVQSGPPIAQSSYSRAGSSNGGRHSGGGGRGHYGHRPHGSGPSRGRGRGRGRGGNATSNSVASAVGNPTMPAPPPRMAWCELCRVDCNTFEILEQHKNGKKHKKNLQVYEELQKLNKVLVGGQTEQPLNSSIKPQTSQTRMAFEENKLPQESLSTQSVTEEHKVEIEQQKELGKAEQTEEPERQSRMDHFGGRGQGFKRKMRGGGRGNKWMRTHDGSRRPIEPPKPKEIIPLICELCNVKCETPLVFNSHLKGKKHLANAKRFQSQQAMLGQAALQALYPALQALYPALQALWQPNNNASTSFDPQFLQQQGINGLQSFLEAGPSSFAQGQSSAAGPSANTASAPPSILEAGDQHSSLLQGSSSEAAGIPSSETAPSDQVALTAKESETKQIVPENKEPTT